MKIAQNGERKTAVKTQVGKRCIELALIVTDLESMELNVEHHAGRDSEVQVEAECKACDCGHTENVVAT